ncbi:MAG: hypothetical protein Q4C36_04860 [Coriobacteriia bacterium]|nr:hypothetical protein [Coriobacteriia bacterium]
MPKIAAEKRMRVVAWAAVACLLAVIALLSLNAYAVEGASSSSTAASASASASTASALASTAKEDAKSTEKKGAESTEKGDAASKVNESDASDGSEAEEESAVARALSRNATADVIEFKDVSGVSADSAGSVFTFVGPLISTEIGGDLYWVGDPLKLANSRVGNDVMGAGFNSEFTNAAINGDVRLLAQRARMQNAIIQGNVDLLGLEINIDRRSAARGYYCGGGAIHFEGTSNRFIAYGQSVYFDGVVEGDVTLSAQDIYIGPNARITGLLDIRSGQNLATLDIPASAQIGRIDTNLDHPNTIDQITQIRAAIAPYFQVGSMLFLVVSFILLGLASLWGFGHKLTEADRLVHRYPLAMLVLGTIAILFAFVIVMLGAVLIFTIPLSIIVALAFGIAFIYCVPFTGASIALRLRDRIRPTLCVILGCGIGAALLFVPYVNAGVMVASMLYFVGYMVNIMMFGHDSEHDSSFHARQADEDAPSGKASGILPVVVTVPDDSQ